MPQSGVFSLNSSHISFAHDLVTIRNKTWVDFPAISDIEITVPFANCLNVIITQLDLELRN